MADFYRARSAQPLHYEGKSRQSPTKEARHAADTEGALFRPVSNNRTGELDNTITPDGVYKELVH